MFGILMHECGKHTSEYRQEQAGTTWGQQGERSLQVLPLDICILIYVYMYIYVYGIICMVITYSRVWIDRARLPILLVVS